MGDQQNGWWARARGRTRELISEGATPFNLGAAAALGAFLGTTPLLGVQTAAAFGLAGLFGLNRLVAVLVLNLAATPALPLLALASAQVGSLTLYGTWLDAPAALHETPGLMGAWLLGSLPVGLAFGGIVGLTVGLAARRLRAAPTPA